MADIVLSVRAYCKMILHVMKFPHQCVNGIFIAEKNKNKDGAIIIVDAIPLFHINKTVTPMLEIAFMQVDQYCKSKGLVIAGYYQANENFRDSNPNFVAHRIAERIVENFADCCLVMIDNQKLSLECEDVAFHLYQLSDSKWKLKDKNCIHMELGHKVLEIASSLLYQKAYQTITDFDNHLDDLSQDWTNSTVTDAISKLM